jgi:hypothetical protein
VVQSQRKQYLQPLYLLCVEIMMLLLGVYRLVQQSAVCSPGAVGSPSDGLSCASKVLSYSFLQQRSSVNDHEFVAETVSFVRHTSTYRSLRCLFLGHKGRVSRPLMGTAATPASK